MITDCLLADSLQIVYCDQYDISDAAFAHLAGIHTLGMSFCSPDITGAASAHLAGIHTLNMEGCSQATITDAAFDYLAGIHSLNACGLLLLGLRQ